MRRNSKGIPDAVKNARLQVGETIYRRNAALLVVAFRDKTSVTKPVLALSTFCNAENKEIRTAAGRQVTKPRMITDFYTTGMGGVDVSDKKIYHLASERATHRYWLKLFMNLIDKSMLNAFIIYESNTDDEPKLNRHNFAVQVIESFCEGDVVPPAVPAVAVRPAIQARIPLHKV